MAGKKIDVDVTIDNTKSIKTGGNNPKEESRFTDFGFGMFIHLGLDSLMSSVISHWMVGADEKLTDDFIDNFPSRFSLKDLDLTDWAFLAQQAGMKYAVLTAKHHAGFCLWDTKTTPFNIMNTPFRNDLLKEYLAAFNEYGVRAGVYFSPIDFYYNHRIAGKTLHFATPEMLQENNPDFLDYNTRQVEEIMNNYGDIYCMFFDGPPDTLKDIVWKSQPDCLVTRGEMDTPERTLPDGGLSGSWEGCYTLGDGWSYRADCNTNQTANDFIRLLIKIRARGGNMLLNITPDAKGKIPQTQEAILQEMGLFNFFNGEAIYGVRPYSVLCEDDESVYYSQSADKKTTYAYVMDGWPHFGYKGRHEITLKKLRAGENTTVRMVGSNEKALEHRPSVDCATRFRQEKEGLTIDALFNYRPLDNRFDWKHPLVFALTNVTVSE